MSHLISAVERAEAEALAAHEAGACHLSEWSCSWCPGGMYHQPASVLLTATTFD